MFAASSILRTAGAVSTAIKSVNGTTASTNTGNTSNKNTSDEASAQTGKGNLTKALNNTQSTSSSAAKTNGQVGNALNSASTGATANPYTNTGFASPAAGMFPPTMNPAAALGGALGGGGGGFGGATPAPKAGSRGGGGGGGSSGGGGSGGGCQGGCPGSPGPGDSFGGNPIEPSNYSSSPGGRAAIRQGLDPKTNQGAQNLNNIMQGANDKPILVKFGAEWCQPCRTFDSQNGISQGGQKTDIEGATLHDKGDHSILKVNVDNNEILAKQIGVDISQIPSVGYAYRREDGLLNIATSLSEATSAHTKIADIKIAEPDNQKPSEPAKPTEPAAKETPQKEPEVIEDAFKPEEPSLKKTNDNSGKINDATMKLFEDQNQ